MKGMALEFLQSMTSLKSLKFVLGGVESIESLGEMPAVEDMAFTMVRGLSELGDLQRFPSLERFIMQDQPQVADLKFGALNTSLKHVWLYNCPKLSSLGGISKTPELESLHAVKTGLSLKGLPLPKSLTHLSLYSGKASEEAKEKAAIEALGYIPEASAEMPFFYK